MLILPASKNHKTKYAPSVFSVQAEECLKNISDVDVIDDLIGYLL